MRSLRASDAICGPWRPHHFRRRSSGADLTAEPWTALGGAALLRPRHSILGGCDVPLDRAEPVSIRRILLRTLQTALTAAIRNGGHPENRPSSTSAKGFLIQK